MTSRAAYALTAASRSLPTVFDLAKPVGKKPGTAASGQ